MFHSSAFAVAVGMESENNATCLGSRRVRLHRTSGTKTFEFAVKNPHHRTGAPSAWCCGTTTVRSRICSIPNTPGLQLFEPTQLRIWDSDHGNPPVDLKQRSVSAATVRRTFSRGLQFWMLAQRGRTAIRGGHFPSRTRRATRGCSRTFNNCTAVAPLDTGAAAWTDYNGVTNQCEHGGASGARLFLTTNALRICRVRQRKRFRQRRHARCLGGRANLFNKFGRGCDPRC